MARLIIDGGKPLEGTVQISGAKNSALAIIVAAALATEGESVLENIPHDGDVGTICLILRSLGVEVWFDRKGHLHVNGRTLSKHQAPYHLVRKMRAYSTPPVCSSSARASVPLPGDVPLVLGRLPHSRIHQWFDMSLTRLYEKCDRLKVRSFT